MLLLLLLSLAPAGFAGAQANFFATRSPELVYGGLGSNPYVDAGDFNGDGLDDLAMCHSSHTFFLFTQRPDHTFEKTWEHQFPYANPCSLHVTDFNSDGIDDVVLTNGLAIISYRGKPTGGMDALRTKHDASASHAFSQLVDLDGDGIQDLVSFHANASPTQLVVAPGRGNGRFGPELVILTAGDLHYSGQIAAGDFNSDGRQDLAVAWRSTPEFGAKLIHVLYNEGGGNFRDLPIELSGGASFFLYSGDVNGDGRADLLVPAPDQMRVLEQQPNGTLSDPLAYYTYFNPLTFVVGDLNKDGRQDVVVNSTGGWASELGGGQSPYVTAYLQTNSILVAQVPGFHAPNNDGSEPKSIAIGQFGPDDCPDVVLMAFGRYQILDQAACTVSGIADVALTAQAQAGGYKLTLSLKQSASRATHARVRIYANALAGRTVGEVASPGCSRRFIDRGSLFLECPSSLLQPGASVDIDVQVRDARGMALVAQAQSADGFDADKADNRVVLAAHPPQASVPQGNATIRDAIERLPEPEQTKPAPEQLDVRHVRRPPVVDGVRTREAPGTRRAPLRNATPRQH